MVNSSRRTTKIATRTKNQTSTGAAENMTAYVPGRRRVMEVSCRHLGGRARRPAGPRGALAGASPPTEGDCNSARTRDGEGEGRLSMRTHGRSVVRGYHQYVVGTHIRQPTSPYPRGQRRTEGYRGMIRLIPGRPPRSTDGAALAGRRSEGCEGCEGKGRRGVG